MRLAALFAALALGGCALAPSVYDTEPVRSRLESGAHAEAGCARLFADVDRVVDRAGVRDARATRIPGHPYLRSDRVLAGLAADAREGAAFDAWLRLASRLDEESRAYELANLGDGDRRALPDQSIEKALSECRVQLAGADAATPESRERLREAARVPPEYRGWQRTVGLYPLTRIPFARGVKRWQLDTEAVFNTPPGALPRRGRLVRYAPGFLRPPGDDVMKIVTRPSRHPLGLPDWTDAERELVFIAFAPELMIDEAGPDDRLGGLDYDHEGRLWVNFFKTVVYRRLTVTRLGGRWLPQLVYSVWFPARTARTPLDPLAGAFDGVTWRVTLGPDGRPIVFDTMHNCGCYHLFIPTPAVQPKPAAGDPLDEALFTPQALNRVQLSDGVSLRLEAGTHYLQRVVVEETGPREARLREAKLYELVDDDELRSLPLPGGGRRSAFGPDGLVAGSERAERFVFWPMGVPSAGAMRQWGRHATAFVGMRHFDDPDLLDRYFELR